jgi:hypothetical protein
MSSVYSLGVPFDVRLAQVVGVSTSLVVAGKTINRRDKH